MWFRRSMPPSPSPSLPLCSCFSVGHGLRAAIFNHFIRAHLTGAGRPSLMGVGPIKTGIAFQPRYIARVLRSSSGSGDFDMRLRRAFRRIERPWCCPFRAVGRRLRSSSRAFAWEATGGRDMAESRPAAISRGAALMFGILKRDHRAPHAEHSRPRTSRSFIRRWCSPVVRPGWACAVETLRAY